MQNTFQTTCFFLVTVGAWILNAGALSNFVDAQESRANSRNDSQRIEQYLRSLQLDRLVVEHLELETASETDEKSRLELARRLVWLYSERMMNGSETTERDRRQFSILLLTYPEFSTPTIRMASFQAKYSSLEKAFLEWWYGGANAKKKGALARELSSLNGDLKALKQKLEEEYQDRVTAMQASIENRTADSQMILQTENLILHAHYLSGWTNYFRGLLAPGEQANCFRTADHHFREFLQIELHKNLNEVSPKWFDFTSDWNLRALVGLAMSEKALDHVEQSEYCLNLIGEHASNQRTRDLRFVWQLNSQLYVDDYSGIDELVKVVEASNSISDVGQISFWNEFLKASIAIREKSLVKSNLLLKKALSGLARNFQEPMIKKFVDQHSLTLENNEFWQLWIKGYLAYEDAVASKNAKTYSTAKQFLEDAIRKTPAENNPFDVACCRFLVARIELQEKNYAAAAKTFEEVSDIFLLTNSQLAAESQWLTIVAYSKLREIEPRTGFQAIRAIDQAILRFPGTSVAKRAQFERLRLSCSHLSTEESLETYRRIKPGNSNYPAALNEIVKANYKLYLTSCQLEQSDSSTRDQQLEELEQAEEEYRKHPGVPPALKLKASFLLVDGLLKDKHASAEQIRKRLTVSKALAGSDRTSSGYQAYRYYVFQLAVRMKDRERIESEGQWQVEHGKGTSFEKSAMIQLAQIADQEVKSQSKPDFKSIQLAISRFEQLLELVGSSDSSLQDYTNARVAYSRLAELYLVSGNHDQAIAMSENLLRLFPKHVLYIRQLARAETQVKNFDQAIALWRQISSGVEAGSESWVEAKFNLAFCHFQSKDLPRAEQILTQTIRLGGKMSDQWKARFEELKQSVESANSKH